MAETVITNARLILADRVVSGTVVLDGERIRELGDGVSSLPGALDFEGDHVGPGLVELHTDNLERHVSPRPNARWPASAAVINHDREIASAGITTVCNALSLGQIDPDSQRLETLSELCAAVVAQRDSGHLKADHHLHLRCEVSFGGLMDLLEGMIDTPCVKLMSLMDHTPGQRQFVSLEQYAIYYQGKYKMSDAELRSFMELRQADQKLYSDNNRRRSVAMARERGIRLASHDDALASHVEEAVADGVTIAEFPTTREAAALSHAAGLAVLMGGPNFVRGRSHNGNLSARDLAASGQLDIISSDYVPASMLFAAVLADEVVEAITLPQAIAMVSRTPARHAGFDDRGEIAEDLRADLVRFKRAPAGPVIREVWRSGRRVA